MPDGFKTEVFLDFDVKKIGGEHEKAVLVALEEAAIQLVDIAETTYMQKSQNTGKGKMIEGFFDFKSFYSDGGWVGGVFGRDGDWTETIGGRAHFFEYGRSAPGKGRDFGGPEPSRKRAQPPRPFIRPAKNKIKRRLGGITSKELKRIAKKLNRSKKLDNAIMKIANKII